jgi:hypothetical protein
MNGFLTGMEGGFSWREAARTAQYKDREKQKFSVFFAWLRLAVGIFPQIALKNIAKVRCNRSGQTDRPAHDRP